MKEQLQKDFDNTIRNLTLSQKDIEIKKFYLDNFINKGFPNRQEEDWKFSDLNQIIKKNIGELSNIFFYYLVKIRKFPVFFLSVWKTFVNKII